MAQLYDQFNRLIPALKRPDTREMGVVSIRDRWSGYPSRGLTPGRLAQIFGAADAGDLRSQAELFTEMLGKDLHLHSIWGTRRLAVSGLEWQVETVSDSAPDKKVAEFCREQLQGLRRFKRLLRHLLGAIGHGYGAAELLWKSGSQATLRGFNLIHWKNISLLNSRSPLVITADNSQGVEPEPFKLAWHDYDALSGHDAGQGVFRVSAYMYLFKNYAIKDWAAFNEIFGMPLRLGKYEPSATPTDKEALRMAISSLGSDAAGIISKSTEIEFVEAAQRLSGITNPYEVMANFCNREMSKGMLGQTLTTDTQGSTGTYSAGKVQQEVRKDIQEADAEDLAETVREYLLRPLVGFNFGWDVPVPEFSFLLQEEQDLKSDSEMIKNLVGAGAGAQIPARHINKHFGIPEPVKGEAVLGAPAPGDPGKRGQGGPGRGGDAGKRGSGDTGLKAILPLREGGLSLIPQDAGVIKAQEDLEALTQAAVAGAADAAARMLAPVRALIDSGATLEALRDGLLAAYPEMNAADLGELLYQARMLALMKARAEGEQAVSSEQ